MKDESIKFRLTQEEKERIRQYAIAHGMTISDFVRWACDQVFKNQE